MTIYALALCPCGTKPLRAQCLDTSSDRLWYWVECPKCRQSGPRAMSECEAAMDWNGKVMKYEVWNDGRVS